MTTILMLRIFLPFCLGYFLSYLYRTVNAVIVPELVRDIGLDADDLGFLTSAYFFAFAAFQLPLGILLDRFGPRRTESLLLILAAMGSIVFAVSNTVEALTFGRALIGIGVSACLMASFKAFVLWFPRERLPLANGVVMMAGGLGAISATVPVEVALGFVDWRIIFLILGAATLAVSGLLWYAVPEQPSRPVTAGWNDEIRGVRQVYMDRFFWRIAPVTIFSQAAFLSVQSLWVGPWLRDVAGLDRSSVANTLFAVACAMVAGFLALGVLTERLSRFGVRPMSVAVTGMIVFVAVQAGLLLSAYFQVGGSFAVILFWSAFGFFGTIGIIPYAVLSQSFPSHLAGRAITALNLLVFLSAFAWQAVFGLIVNMWSNSGINGYAREGYFVAFTVVLVLQVVGLIMYGAMRENPENTRGIRAV